MSLLTAILNLFTSPNVNDQMKAYIKKHGYPKDNVVFSDRQGRLAQIIGTETILKANEKFKNIKTNKS